MPTAPRLTDVELLRAAGEALHGREWRRPLARAVGVSGSHIAALDVGRISMSASMRRRLGEYAGREAAAEVTRARGLVAVLQRLRDRFADKI